MIYPSTAGALLFSPTCIGICAGRAWAPSVTLLDFCHYQVWVWERFLQLQPPIPPLGPDVPLELLPLARRWVLRRGHTRHNLSLCRDILDLLDGAQVWVWERFLQLQPPIPPLGPDVPLELLPLARRWVLRRGHTRHNLSLCRDILDLLDGAQFIWAPYSDTLIAGLPDYCSAGRLMWGSSVPLLCLDIVEHHATERVLRQFGKPQLVPTSPTWEATHYQRDDRTRVDDQYLAWLQDQIFTWDQRLELIPPPPSQSQDTEHDYMAWYRGVTRLFVGNPIHRAGSRYVPYAGRHEALAIGLHLVHQLGLQMQQYAGDPAVALQEYGRQVTELAARTLHRAREDERLEHVPAYVAPEHYHRGKPVPRARGRRGRAVPRGSGAPRGRGGRRGGPQQRGVEAPDEDVGADMSGYLPQPDQHPSSMLSYSLQLALIPATSQVTPLDPLLITSTSIIGD